MPAYSTDKGFTGTTKGPSGLGGGSAGTGGDRPSKTNPRESSVPTKGPGKGKKKGPNDLPSGLNPLKYESNPTPSFEPTPENVAKVVGTIVGAVAGPVGTAAQAAYTGYKALTDDEFDPLNPFDNPTGTVPGSTYDASETINPQTGQVTSQMGVNPIAARASAEQKKKKKTATKPGYTLLEGVGGTLLGT